MEAIINKSATFNGPLETGVRLVIILNSSFPKNYDIQRLTALDYLLVHTSILGGPNDLHPQTPIKTPLTQVRRKIIQNAVSLLISRNIISQNISPQGIYYSAGESSDFFVNSFRTSYLKGLDERAKWLNQYFKNFTDREFETKMNTILEDWITEFQENDFNLKKA